MWRLEIADDPRAVAVLLIAIFFTIYRLQHRVQETGTTVDARFQTAEETEMNVVGNNETFPSVRRRLTETGRTTMALCVDQS